MANYVPLLSHQIVIDSSNQDLQIEHTTGTGADDLVITAGTYSDIGALLAEIEIQLKTVDAGFSADWYMVTAPTIYVRTTISHTSDLFDINWTACTEIGDILGFDTSADDTNATAFISDDQPMYTWCAEHPPEEDSWDLPEIIGSDLLVARSGKTRRVVNPVDFEKRRLRLSWMTKEKFHPDHANTNEDFVTFWKEIAKGTKFEYYESMDGSPLASEGTFALESPIDNLLGVRRLSPDAAYFSLDMVMRKDEV